MQPCNYSTFVSNNVQVDLTQIINIIKNLTINLPSQASTIDEASGIIQNVTFSYSNQNLNNTYTIVNLAKVNNQQNTSGLNISFKKSTYNINVQNKVSLNNFNIEPEISD